MFSGTPSNWRVIYFYRLKNIPQSWLVMKFDKPAKTFEEQIDLLIDRGLQVDDRDEAIHYLSQLNYYRLAAYCLPFEKKP